MIELTINNTKIEVLEGTSVLHAARQLGVDIPTMCHHEGLPNHPSCMLCIVKDTKTGKLHPSCALKAENGHNIITHDEEVLAARKDALELFLSDHVGDCEAPCRTSCPAYMDIPRMNRLIVEGRMEEALQIVKQEIALPLILGYICPAPCEKACRRTQVDEAVSICKLKRFVAEEDLKLASSWLPEKMQENHKKIAIIGTGPAGLSCAYYLLQLGYGCVLFDQHPKAGGALRYDIPDEKLPKWALDAEIELLEKYGAQFRLNTKITKEYFEKEVKAEFDAWVLATGNFNQSNLQTFGFDHDSNGLTVDRETGEVDKTGVFACGNVIRSRRMAVTSVAKGKAVALSVDQYLQGKQPAKLSRMFNSKFGKLRDSEIDEYRKEIVSESAASSRIHTDESLSLTQAQVEASRCLHCDCRKPETCKLRIYSDEYQVNRTKYASGNRKMVRKLSQHQLIIFEPEKCIKCNICVEISARKQEKLGFTQIHRGFVVEIGIPLNKSIADLMDQTAIECAKACPTGAISLK